MSDLSLSVHYFPLTVTTLAGRLRTNPLVTVVPVGSTMLTEAAVQIPAGHAGLTGFALSYSGAIIVPFNAVDPWVRGDDVTEHFEVSFPVGSNLQVLTYNEGSFNHTHYLRLKVDDLAYRNANTSAAGFQPPVIG